MKKAIIIICISLSALLILDTLNVGQAITMFYLAGEIPGTKHSLSASTTLQLFALLTGFAVARIGNRALLTLLDRLRTKLKRT